MKPSTPLYLLLASVFVWPVGCASPNIPDGWEYRGARQGGHIGPAIDQGDTGTARFALPLLEIYESNAAMALAGVLDKERRPPASEGYDRAIDRIIADLYGAGFGDPSSGGDAGYGLEVLASALAQPAWTPISAKISVVGKPTRGANRKIPIAEFSRPGDVTRTMLPRGVESFRMTGNAVFNMDELTPGAILVTDQSVRSVEQEAAERGAGAVVSSFLLDYAVDPTGQDRHFDAIFDGTVRPGSKMPSLYVSPRTAENMLQAKNAGATFELVGNVRKKVNELRTVVASIEGAERPEEVIYVVAHVSGSGAGDNAAGVGGMVEIARSIKRLISAGTIERPRRTIRFVFGQEANAGVAVFGGLEGTPVAAIVADMIGASYSKTGAICLLERGWDPGAVVTLRPDDHTPWGAGAVAEEDILPNGLSILIREALVDVGELSISRGNAPWSTREHPWEGGSDHDDFLNRGVAAALVWHFTDFSYSTSLDRMPHVDADELRRTAVAIGAAALATADLSMGDLQRHLDSLNLERQLRLEAVMLSDEEFKVGLEEAWKDWFVGARFWLRALAVGEPLPKGKPLRAIDSY